MSNDVKLEPCPLCRSRAVQGYRKEGARPHAVCMDCGCNAPLSAWIARHQPQREAVLEEALRVAKREIQSLGCDPDDIELALTRINRAALTTSAPAERPHDAYNLVVKPKNPPAVSTDEIVELLVDLKDRGLPDRYNSDVELSDRLDAILSRIRGEDGDASDAALLQQICDNMAEVLKPLPGEE